VERRRYRGLDMQYVPFAGLSSQHTLFLRDATALPGEAAQLSLSSAGCDTDVFEFIGRPYSYQVTPAPSVTVRLLEYEEPRNVAELLAYREGSLIRVRGTLGTATVDAAAPVPIDVPVDIGSARLIGVEIDPAGEPVELGPPPYWSSVASCHAIGYLVLPR
jgi:hypothetical protein